MNEAELDNEVKAIVKLYVAGLITNREFLNQLNAITIPPIVSGDLDFNTGLRY